MRHAWKYAAVLALISAGSVGCTVSNGDDDIGASGTGGTGGTTGGTGGTTTTGGTGGTDGGTGGTSGTAGTPVPSCDPDSTDMVGTPYPNCAPTDSSDECEACIQTSCCEESENCFATDPNNVCGWGGPTDDDASTGVVAGVGEVGCYRACLMKYVSDNGVCDGDGIDMCTSLCMTPMCTLIGSATSDLAGCMQDNCSDKCFGATACDAD